MHEHDAIHQLWNETGKAALATVVEVKGSAYRRPGARMLLAADGRTAGVINGGCLDGDLWARAQLVLETGQAQLACYDTTASQDIVFGLGLGCRGVVKILVEPIETLDWLREGSTLEVRYDGEELGTHAIPSQENADRRSYVQTIESPQELMIFGAGADVVPLQQIAATLGWNIRVVDLKAPSLQRPIWLETIYHPVEEIESTLQIPTGAACVIMTHNFLHDLELLKLLLPSRASYIGILGPRRRTDELLDKMETATILPSLYPTEEQLDRLFAPIGLDLGAETPEEIALSIVAEIQRVRRQKSGHSLRERGSIH